MRTQRNLLYQFVKGPFFESIDRYEYRREDFARPINSMLTAEWRTQREGVWFHCSAPDYEVPRQGWKIHISATIENAIELVQAVVPILAERKVSFKCSADKRILSLMTGKSWDRGGSGKFMTIYPRDVEQFLSLLSELHAATMEFTGPYILSDRRFPGSRVLHYRYGTMQSTDAVNGNGQKISQLLSPDGQAHPDRRNPFFELPPWHPVDPVLECYPEQTVEDDGEQGTLREGRYEVRRVLGFSNSGGVYVALDRNTDKEVLIKEARPQTNRVAEGYDAIELLKKEYELLTLVADANISPQPIELFQDWEHWFLVEEYCEGLSLAALGARSSVLLKTHATIAERESFLERYHRIFSKIADALAVLHSRAIVFGDLSPNNVLVLGDDDVRLIDYEGACRVGIDVPPRLSTPGFAPAKGTAEPQTIYDDRYALGAMMLSSLFPVTNFIGFVPERRDEVIDEISEDASIADEVRDCIKALISESPEARPEPQTVSRILNRERGPVMPSAGLKVTRFPVDATVDGLTRFMIAHASVNRSDRLFPPDFRLYNTNKYGLFFGAAGTLWALRESSDLSPALLEWLRRVPLDTERFAPGLGVGLAGIAYASIDLGMRDLAVNAMDLAILHPRRSEQASLFAGLAGIGLAALKLWAETRYERFAAAAREAANELLRTAGIDGDLPSWQDLEGQTHLGLLYGAAGVALFLLYAWKAFGDERYLDAGVRALEFELSHAVSVDDATLSWPYRTDFTSIVLPYWAYGSAGIGSVILRYMALAGRDEYEEIFARIRRDTSRKYTVSTGKLMGIAGIADFHLDCHQYLGDAASRRDLDSALAGLNLYKIVRDDGIAFPGDIQNRISCDLGNGIAGVLMMLRRLQCDTSNPFTLDAYLDRFPAFALA